MQQIFNSSRGRLGRAILSNEFERTRRLNRRRRCEHHVQCWAALERGVSRSALPPVIRHGGTGEEPHEPRREEARLHRRLRKCDATYCGKSPLERPFWSCKSWGMWIREVSLRGATVLKGPASASHGLEAGSSEGFYVRPGIHYIPGSSSAPVCQRTTAR